MLFLAVGAVVDLLGRSELNTHKRVVRRLTVE
jgi:hypothetical protein